MQIQPELWYNAELPGEPGGNRLNTDYLSHQMEQVIISGSMYGYMHFTAYFLMYRLELHTN